MSLSNQNVDQETLDLGSKTYSSHPDEVRKLVSTLLRKQIEERASQHLNSVKIARISGMSETTVRRMRNEILQQRFAAGYVPVNCPPERLLLPPAAGSSLLLGQARVPPQYSMVSVFFITCSLFLSQSAVPLAPGDGQARIPQ